MKSAYLGYSSLPAIIIAFAWLGTAQNAHAYASTRVNTINSQNNPGLDYDDGPIFAESEDRWADPLGIAGFAHVYSVSQRGRNAQDPRAFKLGTTVENDRAAGIAEAWWVSDSVTASGGVVTPTMLIFRMRLEGVSYLELQENASEGSYAQIEARLSFQPGTTHLQTAAAISDIHRPFTLPPSDDFVVQNELAVFPNFVQYDSSQNSVSAGSNQRISIYSINTTIDFQFPINTGTNFTFELRAYTAVYGGIANALYSNTAVLESILLPDGSTPESHGITLTFASGMTSPNLPIPEPTGLELSVMLALSGVSLRRTRLAASTRVIVV